MGYEMPEGNDDDDEDDSAANGKDEVASKLDVDLSKPLRKGEELLPTIKAYERKSRYEVEEELRKQKAAARKEKKEGKGEKKDKKDKKSKKDKKGKDDDEDAGADLLVMESRLDWIRSDWIRSD